MWFWVKDPKRLWRAHTHSNDRNKTSVRHGQPQLPSSSITFEVMSEDILKNGQCVENKALRFSMMTSIGSIVTSVSQPCRYTALVSPPPPPHSSVVLNVFN